MTITYKLIDRFGDKDLSNRRIFDLSNGNKIMCDRRDPYGFWHLYYEHGQLPDKLKDMQFTSFDQARKFVEAYIATLNEMEKVKELTEARDAVFRKDRSERMKEEYKKHQAAAKESKAEIQQV